MVLHPFIFAFLSLFPDFVSTQLAFSDTAKFITLSLSTVSSHSMVSLCLPSISTLFVCCLAFTRGAVSQSLRPNIYQCVVSTFLGFV